MTQQFLSQVNTQRNKKTSVPTKTCTQIFIPKLFTTAKKSKQLKYSSTDDEQLKHTYNGVLYSKKKEGNAATCYNRDET